MFTMQEVLFVICFLLCVKEATQTVINPSNLNENGQNVCVRRTTQVESFYTVTATTSYTYTTTSCGWWGWSRCGTSRPKTVYRTVQRTRSVSVKVIYCCSGWRKSSAYSRQCTEAICSQGCDSSHGSCVAPNTCRCSTGWTGNTCVSDIDECASSNGGCDQICSNTPGSYQCGCNLGYTQHGHSCQDIDECQTLIPSPCSCGVPSEPCGATCTNTVPGYVCSCANGFQLRSGGTVCDDINECSTGNGGCPQTCHNSPGKFSCGCYNGYLLSSQGNGSHCVDIDECQSSNGFCTHTCVNTDGSYRCECPGGYYLDTNGRSCSDHNECLLSHHGCQHECNNFLGSYFCSCRSGYALNNDNKTCSDVNECNPVYVSSLNKTIIPAGCDQVCHNTQGNFTCSCNQGFQLLYDGKRCRDINECNTGAHSCEHKCHNTPGSYGCSCLHGYKLKADMRTCEGLPCEAIMAPPHGYMNCSGLVTNETCWFTCEGGYDLQGSERRTCLNSSKWDGQQPSCKVKDCGRLFPPEKGKVLLPCYTTFGSTCTRDCADGHVALGNNLATCRMINSSHVAWDIGNFTCEEIVLCKPNPCRHGGKCIVINSRDFSCDCQHTGYEGKLCETGVVMPPDFPKFISGKPSQNLTMLAKPDNSLTVQFNPTMNLTFEPRELVIPHPMSKAEFRVTGHKPGVGMVAYDLAGVDTGIFASPKNSSVFVGHNISSQDSVYSRLGLLVGELPVGCQKEKLENFPCEVTVAFDSTSTVSNDVLVESGPVHIVTSDNKTIPISVEGYTFSSPLQARQEMLQRLISHTKVIGQSQPDESNPNNRGCSPFHQTTQSLLEFIQKDALPKSFLRYFTSQMPLWLKIMAGKETNLFATENTLAYLIQTTGKQNTHTNCKFSSTGRPSAMVIYQPLIQYSVSVQNAQASLSSKDCCFATDICEGGAFLSLSEDVSKEISTMPFMKDMADGGWKFSLSSVGFTTLRKYSTITNRIPIGPWAEYFLEFHYNLWWQGSADILLKNSSNFAISLQLIGEAFSFVEGIDSLFTSYFSRAMKSIFHGSVAFNLTVLALGQKHFLAFYADDVTGKTIFGGTPLPASNCAVTQGFAFTLDRSCKPFQNSFLSAVVQPYGGSKYLQIFHSVTGGEDISAQDGNNNLRSLEWQTQEIKRLLLDVQSSVPELQASTNIWSAKVDTMLLNVIKARRLLSSPSDIFPLKVLVAEIDDDLDTISRVFDLLVAQLQPFRNRTRIETIIDRFIKLKKDLPKTISLSFTKSSILQNFLGLRFTLNGQVCHKRLCFKNMKCDVWSLRDNSCVTNSSIQEASIIIEGTALKDIFLGSFITYPSSRPLRMLISRNSEPPVTTFESLVNVLQLQRNTTIKMVGHELFFSIRGPVFGKFEALLNVKADFKNVVDWKSVVFDVKGTMNKSSTLHSMLEKVIANETALAATEAARRLSKAQATFNDAKVKADTAVKVLKLKQAAAEELRIEKERAVEELRFARLKYQLAKVRFNSTVYYRQNIQTFVCEIQECNYTCFEGCVIPDLCQDPINITYLERYCETVDKPITIQVVEKSTETRGFDVATYQTVYTGNCRSGVPLKTILNYAKTGFKIGKFVGGLVGGAFGGPVGKIAGKVVGGIIGGVAGGLVGYFKKKIFGCSNTYERIPGEPQRVEYEHKVFEAKAVEKIIKEVKCTNQDEKTKRGGYGPPYPCCKQYGCQTKVLDPICVMHNDECLIAMNELKFTFDAMNETFQSAYFSLRNSVDEVKRATSLYEKARIRHEFAVSVLNKVKSHTEQRLSAVEIVNASMLHVRQIVDFGLKIAQAINASSMDNKKAVDVGELKFAFSMSSRNTKKIIFQTDVRSGNGQQKSVSFLVDFDQIERSVSSASKTIIAKLFGSKHSKRKRSVPEDESNQANSTQSIHSSFTDYPYACLFVNSTHLYLSSIFQSLGDLISSVKGLNVNLSSGFYDLERLAETVNHRNLTSSNSSVNATLGDQNSTFVTEYMEIIETLKNESAKLTNDSSQSWNDTLEAWRAYLEIFTANNGFEECSGTEDCIDYFFEGAKEFYEFEDSPRAVVIKEALPQLREVVESLTTGALTMVETEQALRRAVSLLTKTHDNSVLCGGTPVITSSSAKEVILLSGDSLLLRCTAKSEAALKYAWKRNDKFVKESLDGTFYEHAVSKAHEGAYVCVVSNNKGSTLSNVTIVKVHSKPRITQHPQPQRVIVGSQIPATFICNATGKPTPSFQWFLESTNSSVVKLNETRPVLYMSNPGRQHEGYYYCEVSNEHGAAVSQKARLDVLGYTIGLPRLLVALNLTSRCWLTGNSSNSSNVQEPLSCENDSKAELPSSITTNMTGDIVHSLAKAINVSVELISDFDYYSSNSSTATVAFIVDIDKKPWKEDNFTSFVQIVERLAVVKTNLIEKLEQFNSDILNKTFELPWNNTALIGEPGSLAAYPLSPECPKGQALDENGYICANCPAGLYSTENETCVECPLGTYQPVQGQTECIPCGTNLTTAFNGIVEEADCIADCPTGSYSTKNRTCAVCPLGTYQPSRGRPKCIACGTNLTTLSNGTVEERHCIANCPAGSHSATNRTCALCPLGTYQPSGGQKDCIPCEKGLSTTSVGAVSQSQCKEIEVPSSDSPGTETRSTVNTEPSEPSEASERVTVEHPTESAGKKEQQEDAEESSWKLPVAIVVPSLIVILFLAVLLAFCIKKIRAKDPKSAADSTTTRFDNPTYDSGNFQPDKKTLEDNVYETSLSVDGNDNPDLPEQVYENIKDDITRKDLMDEFADSDDEIYSNVGPPSGDHIPFSFTNEAYNC